VGKSGEEIVCRVVIAFDGFVFLEPSVYLMVVVVGAHRSSCDQAPTFAVKPEAVYLTFADNAHRLIVHLACSPFYVLTLCSYVRNECLDTRSLCGMLRRVDKS
jgi:hypothetical protein